MNNQESAASTRNFNEYIKLFFRRKWLFAIPVFIGLVGGIIASLVMPPKYESSTVILVEEERIINPLIQDIAVSTDLSSRMLTIKEQLLGWKSLVELTKKLNLDSEVRTQGQFEDLILGLKKNINVQIRVPNLIKLAYIGDEPNQTQLVTKTLTDILIEENMRTQTKQTDVAISFIKEQLEVYKKKIKEAEIADMEDQLKGLLIDSTEEHPVVKDLRVKIDTAKAQLETGEFEVKPSNQAFSGQAVEAIKTEISKITKEDYTKVPAGFALSEDKAGQEDPNKAIYKLMLLDKLDTVLARDIKVNENIYNMLLQKLETAKITQRLEASKEGTRYTIIDPPRVPLKPSRPNKLLVIFIGIFFGACSGAGIVVGREFMDHSILDIDEAKETLDFPVLGGISRLTTEGEINRERTKRIKITALILSLSAVLVIIAYMINLLRK